MHTPDNWVIVHIKGKDPHYRVLAGWVGGYLGADRWRLNSGITRVEDAGQYYNFYAASGSCYRCHKNYYGLRRSTVVTWERMQDTYPGKIDLMGEDTDWMNIDWGIK